MSDKSNELVKYETDKGPVALSLEIVANVFAPKDSGVSPAECKLFIELCRYQKLNPFLKEAYIVKYSKGMPASLVVGKEAFTKRAEKHDAYDGCKAGIYVKGASLEKRVGSFYLEGEAVVGGWAEVWRKDQEQSIEASVAFKEYAGTKSDGSLTKMWATKPATMIRKVALVQALREAFPDVFGGMYTEEEMQGPTQVADEIKMPSEKKPETVTLKDENGKEFVARKLDITAEDKANAEDLDKAADAGFKASEIKDDAPSTPEQSEGTYAKIIALVNTNAKEWGSSKILPIMKKANAAKDNEEELVKLYNEIKE